MSSTAIHMDASLGAKDGRFSQVSIKVPDIRCAACALKIERELVRISGINRCRTSLATKTVVVDHNFADPDIILSEIKKLGFSPLLDDNDEAQRRLDQDGRYMLARLGVAGIGMMQVMMFALVTYVSGPDGIEIAYVRLMQWASLAMATPVAFYSAAPFHKGALTDLKLLNPGMDVPVSLAILSAYFFSLFNVLTAGPEVYFDSVCMFTFFLLVGRYVELASRRKHQDSVDLGASCLPVNAKLASTGVLVPIADLNISDLVRVEVGELISADGIIKEGSTAVSEMAFTGESLPIEKSVGARVLAGSVNLECEIVVETSVKYEDFVIKKMADLYTESTLFKPKFSILADRIARYFVVAILGLAFVTGLSWYLLDSEVWFSIALTVLVVSCPCALSLATPVAYTVAVASLRKFGVVVSTGEFLEKLADTNRIVFDKTGTLTTGDLTISKLVILEQLGFQSAGFQSASETQVIALCAALEKVSRHPIARAFELHTDYEVSQGEYSAGLGVSGTIDGVCYRLGVPEYVNATHPLSPPDNLGIWILLAASEPLAWINLSDEVRANSASLISDLKGHYQMSMLTGDSQNEALRVANLVGIDAFDAKASPSEKVAQVKAYQAKGDKVLMVGDGINDAAAMGIAHASVAVSPVDIVVQEAAGATLLQNDITRLSTLLGFSIRVRSVIRQNIYWALGYNLFVIPLAVSGILEPWMAALGMSLSSLLVVLNANRLRWIGEK